ncbi:MAG: SDR family NAD(P)-dependent oxidoreductase [Leptospiraceae bacterium]|nr:SDR family NAD(P)-dependent oxidoreductase [Leptospiraceae bacterium]
MSVSRQSKSALVTGGAVRLGRAFVWHLASRGYHIGIHYNQSDAAARSLKAELERTFHGIQVALLGARFDAAFDAERFVQQAARQLPDLQLLVNSASLYIAGTVADSRLTDFSSQMLVNCFIPIELTRAWSRLSGDLQIINIIDNKIHFNQNTYCAYLLSKKALAEFTRMAALEYAPRLRINAIAPGVSLPAESRSNNYLQWRQAAIPMQRIGGSEPLLHGLDYLLDASFVCGQILTVDGGESLMQIGRNAVSYQDD